MELVLFICWFVIGPFTPMIIHRRYPELVRSIRFIASYITIYLGGISIISGIATRDVTIFLITFIISLWGGLQVLLLPRTAPRLVKRFNLKW